MLFLMPSINVNSEFPFILYKFWFKDLAPPLHLEELEVLISLA